MAVTPQSITDVSYSFPGWTEIWNVFTLQSGYNSSVVVLGTTFLGIAAGVVGTFALLRNRALMGDALSHAALPGLALAFILATVLGFNGKTLPILLSGATVTGVLAVLTIQFLVRNTRIREDAAIGAVLSVYFGIGITLLSVIQSFHLGNPSGLNHFIYGQTAAIQARDAWLTATLAFAAITMAILFLKEFRLICFNEEYASALGWSVNRLDIVMMSFVVLVTVIGLQSVGLILIIALLIIPPCAARFWTERFDRMLILSGTFGGLAGYFGSCVSSLLPRLPTGPVIVLSSGVLFCVSFLIAPERGLLANIFRRLRLRVKITRDHILRTVFEMVEAKWNQSLTEPNTQHDLAVDRHQLFRTFSWSPVMFKIHLHILSLRGFLYVHKDVIRFTQQGLIAAYLVTRNHRLWEEFLVRYADLATTHVDRAADRVEHVLSWKMVKELETILEKKGQFPVLDRYLPSVHPLTEDT